MQELVHNIWASKTTLFNPMLEILQQYNHLYIQLFERNNPKLNSWLTTLFEQMLELFQQYGQLTWWAEGGPAGASPAPPWWSRQALQAAWERPPWAPWQQRTPVDPWGNSTLLASPHRTTRHPALLPGWWSHRKRLKIIFSYVSITNILNSTTKMLY